uniref:Uncharacterized protein n=1 Tax=Ditylenchus dipsaci TaxID=166011 RepID=A0A915DRY0_9BILA
MMDQLCLGLLSSASSPRSHSQYEEDGQAPAVVSSLVPALDVPETIQLSSSSQLLVSSAEVEFGCSPGMPSAKVVKDRKTCYNNPRNRNWPQPNMNNLDDTRGDELLASLNNDVESPHHGRHQKGYQRDRMRGGKTQQGQQLLPPTIDTEQMRAAIKKLNHEQRINRARGAAAEVARRDANDEDDDPIGH